MPRTSLCRTAINGGRCLRESWPVKNPGAAAVLSFLITALGQIYNSQSAKGLFLVFWQLINIALMDALIGYIAFILL
jgi:TM2 domain-containing membrane protein YozV